MVFEVIGAFMLNIEKTIVHEDKDFYVCHKPAGVLSQADRSFSEDMVSALLAREKIKGVKNPFIAPVNRLDRPVEGLLLLARNDKTAGILSSQITSKSVDKNYYTLADISLLGEEKRADLLKAGETILLKTYLKKDAKTNTSYVCKKNDKDAKEAILEYVVVEIKGKEALLKVRLHTGRHHQIRVMLSAQGMPIVGDTKYNPLLKDVKGWHELALCSCEMSFDHPVTKEKITFTCKPRSCAFAGWNV